MHNITGRWSTAWFYHDPADEVLVFLPDGSGVFEYHWWTLNSYETFSYRVEGDYLYLTVNTQYTSDSEENTVKETPSDIDFSGRFRIREPNPEESAAGCEVILEFETPLMDNFPATKKLGRRVSDADVSDYRLPLFATRVSTRSKSDRLQRRGRPAGALDSTAYSKGRPIPHFDPLHGPFWDIWDKDLQLGPCAFCGEKSVNQAISRVRCERCGRIVCWKCADCGVFSSLSDFQKSIRRRTDGGKDVYLPVENCPNCQEMSWWDKHARPSSSGEVSKKG